ncbi:HBL/NHE enterotoxin family protein [Serratia ureilytica]|uniref:HBL/NHE enterotoxin family protein n=1 Tax=Serratia ureilytica TaxID=300181 RepID=UPI0019D25329|nr:HBL/NHE enterotoxin family protein [Serratia ureilytica]MBN5212237.1 HBL/NHE enterotoxin family protein [Serratia ureilytica]
MTIPTIYINDGMNTQSSQALHIQTYCNSVRQQIPVDFERFPNLREIQRQINTGLATAKQHANHYLNDIQPLIIRNITNIQDYFETQNLLSTVMPSGATKEQWLSALSMVSDKAREYQEVSANTRRTIGSLNDKLIIDSNNYQLIVVNLNNVVNGNNGVLEQLNRDIDGINAAIDGAIAGIVVGGLLIIGGAIVTAIGAVAGLVTAGTSTPVVMGGIAMMTAGAGGVIGGAIVLDKSLSAREKLYRDRSQLNSEVLVASQIGSGYQGLQTQAQSAVTAATQMSNAWDSLTSELDILNANLRKGIIDDSFLRQLFLTASQTSVTKVLDGTKIIKQQMAGVVVREVPANQTIADFVKRLAA